MHVDVKKREIMDFQKIPTTESSQKGMVLLEALIAILLFSMGILALAGLQANMLQNTSSSKYRADASYIAQQQIGNMWASGNAASYVGTFADISAILPSGSLAVASPAADQYTITVTWQPPGDTAHNFTTTASIAGG